MKSVVLTDIQKPEALRSALSRVLPGQEEPWLLANAPGDPIAYFHIEGEEEALEVEANISGRHRDKEEAVVDALKQICRLVGGQDSK